MEHTRPAEIELMLCFIHNVYQKPADKTSDWSFYNKKHQIYEILYQICGRQGDAINIRETLLQEIYDRVAAGLG